MLVDKFGSLSIKINIYNGYKTVDSMEINNTTTDWRKHTTHDVYKLFIEAAQKKLNEPAKPLDTGVQG